MGVTSAALAIGYFLSGCLADRYTYNSLLFSVIGIGSVLIAMTSVAKFALEADNGDGHSDRFTGFVCGNDKW